MKKIILISVLLLTGCAASYTSKLDSIQTDFSNGHFEESAKKFANDKSIEDQNNLELLISGIALFHDNKFAESDKAFEEFNKRNLDETGSSFSREASGLIFGQTVNSYKPYMMDSLFVSYYQLWDLLAMGDMSNARVVINQSYNRQQNMSREYKKLIQDNKKELAENPNVKKALNENNGDWAAFTDIMNPALMYLSGIYFLNNGDFQTAETYLKRANGMMPNNNFIKQDLQFAQQRKKPNNITWEFAESGFAPRLYENMISIYVPLAGISYFPTSEPSLGQNAYKPKSFELLANVDSMFMTEYNEYKINELLRAYTSAVAKTALQAAAYHSNNNNAMLLGVTSTIFSAITSDAEVRTWAALPKYIYVNRVDRKTTNLNTSDFDDNMVKKIYNTNNNLIYMRYNVDLTDIKVIDLK